MITEVDHLEVLDGISSHNPSDKLARLVGIATDAKPVSGNAEKLLEPMRNTVS